MKNGVNYAEWLKKANNAERMALGDVVGLNGGLISKEYIPMRKNLKVFPIIRV